MSTFSLLYTLPDDIISMPKHVTKVKLNYTDGDGNKNKYFQD
jgi:hypothetical protein